MSGPRGVADSVLFAAPPVYSITGTGTVTPDPKFGLAVKGGSATVSVFGSLSGPSGVGFLTSPGYLTNTGQITGTATYGLFLATTGSVSNNGGTITGATIGIDVEKSATVLNFGTVTGGSATTGVGVVLRAGGLLRNASGALIQGGGYGVRMGAGGTVINSGTIAGAVGAVYLGPSGTLIVNPGASFVGEVIASGTNDTLLLGSSASDGTLVGLGTSFSGFGTITEASGATWTLASAQNLSATIGVKAKAVLVNVGGTIGAGVSTSYGVVIDNRASIAGGVDFGGASELLNTGSISGTVTFALGGELSNGASATIRGAVQGAYFQGQSGSIVNAGLIAATAANGIGVSMAPGGDVVNVAGGTISGGDTGIVVKNSAFIYNAGLLSGGATGAALYNSDLLNATGGRISGAAAGISGVGGSSITNRAGASIQGTVGVRFLTGPGTASNSGTIAGGATGTGVYFEGGGSLANLAGATISGGTGVVLNGPGTLVNGGTITGTTYAVRLATSDTLVVNPGAVFSGKVAAAGTLDVLLLASAANAGTVAGIGSSFTGFNVVSVASGATWTVAGSNALGAGRLTVAGTAILTGSLAGNASLAGGAQLRVTGGSLSGGVYGLAAGVVVSDAGTIGGSGNYGASLATGGTVTILAGGQLDSNKTALRADGAAATISNAGTVAALEGIFLNGGGTVTNLAGGTITGSSNTGVVIQNGTAIVTNSGSISGGRYGIELSSGGTITNAKGGTIRGGQFGVFLNGFYTETFSNAGTAYGGQFGVFIRTAGVLTNAAGATISSPNIALVDSYDATIGNAGTISSTGTAAQVTGNVVTLTNAASGVIAGGAIGLDAEGATADTFTNAGSISGTTAVKLVGTGSLSNQVGGRISGGIGVYASGAWTVSNAGTIGGSTDAVSLGSGVTLIDNPGAVFAGKVVATGTADALVLAAGTSAGTITGLGTGFTGFATIREAAGALWTLTSSNTIGAARLSVYGSLANAGYLNGTATIGGGGVFSNASKVNGEVVVAAASGRVVNAGTMSGGGAAVVALTAGGTLTNASGGLISSSAHNAVSGAGGAVSIVNSGSITARYSCISLASGGTIVNNASGVVLTQYGTGVYLRAGGVVNNSGTINATNGAGIFATGAGKSVVTNFAGGYIGDIQTANGAVANIYNAGRIGNQFLGVMLAGTGSRFFNLSGGTVTQGINAYNAYVSNLGLISGGQVAIAFQQGGTVVNSGTIKTAATANAAIYTLGAGTISNLAGGVISGGVYGISGYNGGQVFNAGTIIGSKYAVRLAGPGNVTIAPGAVFSGRVASSGLLELASAAQSGTITGLGTQFTGFANVKEVAGASWTLTGANSVAAGTTFTDFGTLNVTGTLTGRVTLGAGATVVNAGKVLGTVYGVGGPGSIINNATITVASAPAVNLSAGGTLTNAAGGIIKSGGTEAVLATLQPAFVSNSGIIAGGSIGVLLAAGGTVANAKGGTISGSAEGVFVTSATVTNAGLLTGGTAGAYLAGGTNALTNVSGATITGATAVRSGVGQASITNAGLITGTSTGLYLLGGGPLTNTITGRITGATAGIVGLGSIALGNSGQIGGATAISAGMASISNTGTVSGGTVGIDLKAVGTVVNAARALVSGGQIGVRLAGANSLLENLGTISGSKYAVLLSGTSSTLSVAPQAVFSGVVMASAAGCTLLLASGGPAGTISGIGRSTGYNFVDFSNVSVAYGAAWTITGNNFVGKSGINVAGSLTNAGFISGGISLTSGAYLTNQGTIGFLYGVYGTGGPVTIVNSGFMEGQNVRAVYLSAGGYIRNNTAGTIVGNANGVLLNGPGTLVNAGTIIGEFRFGNPGAVRLGGNDTLIMYPGAVFSGGVYASGTGNTLVLASAATSGTVQGIGSAIVGTYPSAGYHGFNAVTEQSGASWTFAGSNSLGSGTTLQLSGTANVTGTLQSGGFVYLGQGGLFSGNLTLGTGASLLNASRIQGSVQVSGDGVRILTGNTIAGSAAGVNVTGTGVYLKNAGAITGSTNYGVHLAAGGEVNNGPAGRITGYLDGVFAYGAPATVSNLGTITGADRAGVYLKSGGSVTNQATIAGLAVGVRVLNAVGTIQNFGTIIGSAANGVALRAGGTVSNNGLISGPNYGVVARASAVVDNAGTISGSGASGAGIYLSGGGYVVNRTGGRISGGATGIRVGGSAAVTVSDSGVIAATAAGGKAIAFDSAADRLILHAGATFTGTVDGGGGTLELFGTAGSVSGLGTSFVNFSTVYLDLVSQWTLGGSNTVASGSTVAIGNEATLSVTGSLVDNGSVAVKPGATLAAAAAVSGTGQIVIGSYGSFMAAATLGVTSVQFAPGGPGKLALGAPGQVSSSLSGFGQGDTVDLLNTKATSATFIGGKLTVLNGTTVVSTLNFTGSLSSANFALASDGHGGTNINFVASSLASYPDVVPSAVTLESQASELAALAGSLSPPGLQAPDHSAFGPADAWPASHPYSPGD